MALVFLYDCVHMFLGLWNTWMTVGLRFHATPSENTNVDYICWWALSLHFVSLGLGLMNGRSREYVLSHPSENTNVDFDVLMGFEFAFVLSNDTWNQDIWCHANHLQITKLQLESSYLSELIGMWYELVPEYPLPALMTLKQEKFSYVPVVFAVFLFDDFWE